MFNPLLAAALLMASTSAIATDMAFSGNNLPDGRVAHAAPVQRTAGNVTNVRSSALALLPAGNTASPSIMSSLTIAEPEPYAMVLLGMAMLATIVSRRIPHEA